MTTHNNPFEGMMDNQKKLWENWTDMSKKMLQTFTGETALNGKAQEQRNELFDKQKELFEEMLKVADFKQWSEWMEKNNQWIKDNMMKLLPENMQPHYQNYLSSYTEMFKYWDSFAKMIEFGMTKPEDVNKYFSTEAYMDFVNKMMGFRFNGNSNEILDNMNKYFDQYIKYFNEIGAGTAQFNNNWKEMLEKFVPNDFNPLFKALNEMNKQVTDQMAPFVNVMTEGKEKRYIKLLKDIQFAFTAYLLKNSEMQTMVYKAGQHVLPEIFKHYAEDFKSTRKLPDYNQFYKKYINELETALMDTLHAKEYSQLQSDVSKAAVTVKSKIDEMVELSFENLPFVMKSQVDDIAKENATLRNKLRSLETKMTDLEAKLKTDATPSAVKIEKPKAVVK